MYSHKSYDDKIQILFNKSVVSYRIFISRLLFYIKPHLGKLALTSILMILATALESALPEVTGRIIDNLFNNNDSSQSLFYGSLIFIIIFISSVFALISTSSSAWISSKIIMQIRVDMFAKLLNFPKTYFDKISSGVLLSKITFDVEQIADMTAGIWLNFVKSSISVIVLTGYLFWTNWQLSTSLVILLPLIYLILKLSARRMKRNSNILQQSMGKLTNHANENIIGNNIVKIYQTYVISKQKFNILANKIRLNSFKVDNIAALNTAVVNILIGICLAFVVYFSSAYLAMSAGEFMAFFTAMGMLVKPTKNLVGMNKIFQKALAAGESVFTLLDEKVELKGKLFPQIMGNIQFENVSFAYAKKPVLNNISFSVMAGESLALVGSTGSGKSTIASLIANFYQISSGKISIDGIDITKINLEHLRRNIAIVEQNTMLFNDNVQNNISPNQDILIKDIKNAANVANATDFIDNLEDGFAAEIGNNGNKLSGGQRQRLAIARAIAKNTPILIFDEATAALDNKTEKQVVDAIDKMQKNRTTIIIAHRLSTIINADKIIVLNHGKIVEFGTHAELLKNNNEYSQLYKNYK